MTAKRPIGPGVMAGLKEFQRATVEYAFRRMYTDPDPVHRFLVADEVGLGKTLVARGLIAKTIDHLREQGVKRIDVIYICSNAQIAQQNIQKLNVTGQEGFDLATRITLLPTQFKQLKQGEINFVSFTPGTSFDMGDRSGRKDERALLYWLLRYAWGSRRLRQPGVYRLLRGGAGEANWESYVNNYKFQKVGKGSDRIDEDIAGRFKANLDLEAGRDRDAGRQTLQERFDHVAGRLRRTDRGDLGHARGELVAELRRILARSAIDAIEPDLIILDEFQRFRHLLDDPVDGDETQALAHQLFDYESPDGHARTLLLSATPYKMYTVAAESGHDDHYQDFVRTSEFLLGEGVGDFRRELRDYRESVVDLGPEGLKVITKRRRAVEARLRRVMARTERLGSTSDRSGMLHQSPLRPGEVTLADVRSYVAFDTVNRTLGTADGVEYWKSAPYPLSFMDGYDVKRKLRAAVETNAATDLAAALRGADGLLDPGLLARYEALDPGNARLRGIADDMVESGAWQMLWVPASMPYYAPKGAWAKPALKHLTKRLIFSSWTVVPQAVASVLSYQAERHMMQSRDPKAKNTQEARRKLRSLLQFRRAEGRPGSMSTLALMYPSPALARLTDPLEIAAASHRQGAAPTSDVVLRKARDRVHKELSPLLREAPKDGPVDEDWYWAAPVLIERHLDPEGLAAFFARGDRVLAQVWATAIGTQDPEDGANLTLHVGRMREIASQPPEFGRPPDDLEEVIALLGMAGPANVALRALSRGATAKADLPVLAIRDAACRVAWGFRSLFGLPEVMSLIRGRSGTERAYWLRVLGYCLGGNLQAVLDEYGHVLPEWLGLLQETPVARAGRVAEGMVAALTIRAPLYGYDAITSEDDRVTLNPQRLRSRFALRFGVDSQEEEGAIQRSGQVRTAFNSPFWPFVLVTTSIGQEGLDFHQYCHAIVHWNLPTNPVDFEQREGRVHRYKGHAVRRNVATKHRREALGRSMDPWQSAFSAAARSRQAHGQKEIVPYWIYEGPHHIERYVPVLPLSREIEQLERLKRSLALYRMVFGQPRQEDLVAWLEERIPPEERESMMKAMRVDLAPPKGPASRPPASRRT